MLFNRNHTVIWAIVGMSGLTLITPVQAQQKNVVTLIVERPTERGSSGPEPILRAALQVLHVAAYTTRNWTLRDEVPRKQINALWEAIHDIPDLVKRWRSDEESLRELRGYLKEYDKSWDSPRLIVIFDQALKDPMA